MSDLFCWLWDFLLENLKLKIKSDNIQWNVWTNIKTLYARNKIFKKRFIYVLVQVSFFRGLFWGVLANAFFNFLSSVNHCGRHFCSAQRPPPRPLTIKKLPTTLYYNNAFTVKDSFSFEDKFLMQDSNLDMASLDGVSLFITISFDEILIFA